MLNYRHIGKLYTISDLIIEFLEFENPYNEEKKEMSFRSFLNYKTNHGILIRNFGGVTLEA